MLKTGLEIFAKFSSLAAVDVPIFGMDAWLMHCTRTSQVTQLAGPMNLICLLLKILSC